MDVRDFTRIHCNIFKSNRFEVHQMNITKEKELEARKDAAYLERNQCVALIARMALALGRKAGTATTAIEGWSEDWHGCVYIDLPEGQVSWHFHDSQKNLFAGLPTYKGRWDGHDTPEKYRRVMNSYIMRGLAEDAEPVSLLKKPSSVDVSDKKAVVDMSRLPLMHQHDAYRMSKALTDHLAVVPVGKDAAPAAWRRPANEGETPTHVVTQIPRVADIWADQGCRVEPLYTSPQAAQTEAQEREEFEAWYADQDEGDDEPERTYELDEDGMNALTKHCVWTGWKAGRAGRKV